MLIIMEGPGPGERSDQDWRPGSDRGPGSSKRPGPGLETG